MNLRNATFSATRWTTAAAIIGAVLQLLQTAILARLLAPADFGLMAIAGAAIAIASLFSDLGMSSALMHFPRPDRRTLSTLYWLNLSVACLLALLFAAVGWPLAAAYHQPDLVAVLSWLALSFPLGASGQQYRVLAAKDLRFKPLVQHEVAAAMSGFVAAIVAAWLGWGVYALVAAQLISVTVSSMLAWFLLSDGGRPQIFFQRKLAKPFMVFGMHRMGDSFWNTARVQADVLIAGFFAAPHVVAVYSVPRNQSLKIANAIINPVITRVGLPVMTRLQHDVAALRSVYLKTLLLTASFNFPIYAMLALFADDIVALLLGSQWHEAGFYMRLFALWGLIRSTGNPVGNLLYAVGMAQRAHIWSMVLFFITVPLFWFATKHGGLPVLAMALLAWQMVAFVLAWRFLVLPACGAGFMQYCASIAPPFITTAFASVITLGTIYTLPESLQLLIGAFSFSGAYMMLSWWLNRNWLLTLFELLSPLKRFLK